MVNLPTQVNNVLSGNTAFGNTGIGPIPFPAVPRARTTLHTWARVFVHGVPHADDAMRTAFIRKLALHIIRNYPLEILDSTVFHGTTWFIAHPHHVQSRMSFAKAAQFGERHYFMSVFGSLPPKEDFEP